MQRSIKKEMSLRGIGLHTGRRCTVHFKPASVDEGVSFIRVDLPKRPRIRADVSSTVEAPRRISLGQGEAIVHTVEHILAAVAGMGIDNLTIEVDGNEVPEVDGSSLPFLKLLKEAGIVSQEKPKRSYKVKSPIWAEDRDGYIAVFPSDTFKISFTIKYENSLIGCQYASFDMGEEVFEREIAGARTFVLEKDVDGLLQSGLGKGATHENTLVVGERGIVDNSLRFADEFVRHKILDVVGHFSLLGVSLKAHILATKSGHSLNLKVVKKIWEVMDRKEVAMDVNGIQRVLPHRYPFLLVDRIVEIEEGKRIVGVKNVTINENFFQGHFPSRPVMPGVLVVEAMAQTAGVLMLKKEENLGKLAYLLSIDKVKLRRTVVPGDQLRLEAEVERLGVKVGRVKTKALVEGRVVAEAEFLFSLVPA